MKNRDLTITPERIKKYAAHLREQERSAATIEKYVHDLTALAVFLAGRPISKGGATGAEGNTDRKLRPGQCQYQAGGGQQLFDLLRAERTCD